jgi:hypothetical protein
MGCRSAIDALATTRRRQKPKRAAPTAALARLAVVSKDVVDN